MHAPTAPLQRVSAALRADGVLHARHGDAALLASFALRPRKRAVVRYAIVGDDLRIDGALRSRVDLDDVPRVIGAANAHNDAAGSLLTVHVAVRGRAAHLAFAGTFPCASVLPGPVLATILRRTAGEVAELLAWAYWTREGAILG